MQMLCTHQTHGKVTHDTLSTYSSSSSSTKTCRLLAQAKLQICSAGQPQAMLQGAPSPRSTTYNLLARGESGGPKRKFSGFTSPCTYLHKAHFSNHSSVLYTNVFGCNMLTTNASIHVLLVLNTLTIKAFIVSDRPEHGLWIKTGGGCHVL